MELPSFHLLRTTFQESFLTSLFLLHSIHQQVLFIPSPKYPLSNCLSSSLLLPLVQDMVISLLDDCPSSSVVPVPSPVLRTGQWNSVSLKMALTGMALLVGHHPSKWKFTGSNPSQGTCMGCRFSPWSGHIREATGQCLSLTLMFLSHTFSLPSPLSENKWIKSFKKLHLTQDRSKNSYSPKGPLWHLRPLSGFLSCHSHSSSLCFSLLGVLKHTCP